MVEKGASTQSYILTKSDLAAGVHAFLKNSGIAVPDQKDIAVTVKKDGSAEVVLIFPPPAPSEKADPPAQTSGRR